MNESLPVDYWNATNVSISRNNSNIIESFEPTEPAPELPTIFIISLIVVGAVGNVLVCLTIFLDKKLQNVTNMFLLSLAVTDLIINVVILPARIAIHTYVLQPSSFPWCFLYLVGDNYLTAASALHVSMISLERYFAIKDPMNMRNLSSRRVYVKIILVWLISFVSIVPYTVILIITEYPMKPHYCPRLISYSLYFDTVLYMESFVIFLMMAVVVFSFVATSIVLYKLTRKHESANGIGLVRTVGGGNQSENSSKETKNKLQELTTEKKAMRVIWLVSFAFVIAMGPYAIINTIYLLSPNLYIYPLIVRFVSYLSYSNSVINPILYTIFNKQFRDNFKNLILLNYKQK